MSNLKKPLTFLSGTSLILNIVIGAGLLALPGLAYKQAGDFALLSWLVCAIVSVPLLAVFIMLGAKYPNAGGLAFFTRKAFGDVGYLASTFVFLGAVSLGLPSIAITGGYFAGELIGGSPHFNALLILIASASVHIFSTTLVARINTVLSACVIITIFSLIGLSLGGGDQEVAPIAVFFWPAVNELQYVFAPFMMIFFAFTGWEIAAGLSEEFKNPKRDYPASMVAAFVIAVILYLSIAYIVQKSNISGHYETAFAQIAQNALGVKGQIAISVIGILIVFANLSAAIWAVSRLIFSLSREGFLPRIVQNTRKGSPYIALALTTLLLTSIIILDWAGFLGLENMLFLAGQNFLILYGFGAAAYFRMSSGFFEHLLAIVTIIIVVTFVVYQGLFTFYPALLIVLGVIASRSSRKPNSKGVRKGEVIS